MAREPLDVSAFDVTLRREPQWGVVAINEEGKPKPFCARTGAAASPRVPATWSTFSEAEQAFNEDERWAGVCYFFKPGDPHKGNVIWQGSEGAIQHAPRSFGAEIRNGSGPRTREAATVAPGKGASDQTLARGFAAVKAGRLLYVEGDQWFFYDSSGAWTRRNFEYVERAAFDWMVHEQKMGARVEVSSRKISGVIRLAKNQLGPEGIEAFDARKELMPLKNGVLNLETGEKIDHAPEHRLTRVLPYSYDADATAPRWMQFLNETLLVKDLSEPCVEWQNLLQEWFGYCLIPSAQAQTSMFWLGAGANGKGVAQKVLEHLVGHRQVAAILMNKLDDPYHLADLHGKYLATIGEIDRNALRKNGQMLKWIIGGDTISGRRPTENVFRFNPFVRIVGSMNVLPRTDDVSEGYFRRVIPIEWRRNFADHERDPMLDGTLIGELPGIFNWALAGLKRWRERGSRFEIPEESKELLGAYRRAEDHVLRFIEETFVQDAAAPGMHSKVLYRMYLAWCVAEGEEFRKVPMVELSRRLGRCGFEASRPTLDGVQARGFFGIRLRLDTDE